MFFRKGRARRARDAVADQVADRTDDLATALEAAREAISKASTAAGRKGAELGKEPESLSRDRARVGLGAGTAYRSALPAGEQVGIGPAAHRACREAGVEPRQRKEREQEGFGDSRGIGRSGLERSEAGEEQEEQANVPLVLLGHLVHCLEHGLPRREQAEVVPEGPERGDDLGLADGVE